MPTPQCRRCQAPTNEIKGAADFESEGCRFPIKRANRDRKKREEPEIPLWHPHQLRHNFGTEIRRQHGLDVARVLLGHSSPVVTEVYAELDQAKAIDALSRSG